MYKRHSPHRCTHYALTKAPASKSYQVVTWCTTIVSEVIITRAVARGPEDGRDANFSQRADVLRNTSPGTTWPDDPALSALVQRYANFSQTRHMNTKIKLWRAKAVTSTVALHAMRSGRLNHFVYQQETPQQLQDYHERLWRLLLEVVAGLPRRLDSR